MAIQPTLTVGTLKIHIQIALMSQNFLVLVNHSCTISKMVRLRFVHQTNFLNFLKRTLLISVKREQLPLITAKTKPTLVNVGFNYQRFKF